MMASQSGVANTYLYSKNIPHLFESLLTGLMYHRPEDPIAFLQNCLEEAKKREGQYSWNCFVTTTNSRSVFSRTKPLPPIQRLASAATPKEKENCIETVTVEHTPPSAGENRAATVQDKPLVFIIGGPGCGKGTQCEKIVSEFGLAHLSAGDLLRAEVARGSRQGERIQEIMREGELVPPEVTIGLLKSAILFRSEAIGFLIDGFPRELSQAHMFESQIGECSVVVMLECSEEVMLERLRRRGETSSRVDDNQETIRKRLVTFSQSTLPVVQHYQKLGKVKLVNADQMVDKVYGEVKEIFQELLTKQ